MIVYRRVNTWTEEMIVVPIGDAFEYNLGDPHTTLVSCLILYSETSGILAGTVKDLSLLTLTLVDF